MDEGSVAEKLQLSYPQLMASKTKVIIAGAGIAGPVLAIFLKMKGYEPVIYEKISEVNDVGLSIL